jgi:hypothetical protein
MERGDLTRTRRVAIWAATDADPTAAIDNMPKPVSRLHEGILVETAVEGLFGNWIGLGVSTTI